jgi:hypothetical protein
MKTFREFLEAPKYVIPDDVEEVLEVFEDAYSNIPSTHEEWLKQVELLGEEAFEWK